MKEEEGLDGYSKETFGTRLKREVLLIRDESRCL